MSTKALREKRAAVTARGTALREKIVAEDRSLTAEEHAEFEAMAKDYAKYSDDIRTIEASYAMEAADRESADLARDAAGNPRSRPGHHDIEPRTRATVTEEQKVRAIAAWVKHPRRQDYLSDQEEAACRAVGIRPDAARLDIQLGQTEPHRRLQAAFLNRERNPAGFALAEQQYRAALSNEIPASGGLLTVPVSMGASLEINMLAFGGLLQAADTMTTETGEDIVWPSADDTTNKGRRIAVNAAVTATAQPAFTASIWKAHEYTSDAILIPSRLLEDDIYDFPGEVGAMLGMRMGRILNTECTTGTGNSMPYGIVPLASTFTAPSSTSIAWDDLKQLMRKVDLAYRDMPGCGFMMHDLIAYQLTLLKDGIGHPLWVESEATGTPSTLMGKSCHINLDMDSTIASGKKTVLYGHIPSYKVRRVRGVTLYRLTELYRANNQDGFMAFLRADGNMAVTATPRIKVLSH